MKIQKTYIPFLQLVNLINFLIVISLVSCVTTQGARKDTLVADLLDKSYTTGKTANGVTYFIKNNQSHQNKIIFSLVVNAGSVLEEDNQLGLAHFVEHMGFNGTAKYPANEMIKVFRENGMRFGEDVNAYTSYDETVFYLIIPDDKPELITFSIGVLDEWLRNMSYNPEEIEKEKGVVQEEVRARGQPFPAAYLAGEKFLLEGTKYGVRNPGGKIEVIATAPREVIKSFYDKWYSPNLAAVSIVGNIDEKYIEKEVLKRFQQKEKVINRPYYLINPDPPDSFKVKMFAINDVQNKNSLAKIYFRKPLQSSRQDSFFENLIDKLMYDLVNQRLDEVLRTSENLASAGIGNQGYGINSTVESIFLEPKEGKLFNGFKELVIELEKLRRWGVSEAEFKQVLRNLINRYQNNKPSNSEWLNKFISHFSKGYVIEDRVKTIKFIETLPNPKTISLDLINKKLSKIGKAEGGRMAIIHALDESLPSVEEFTDFYKKSSSLELVKQEKITAIDKLLTDLESKAINMGKFVSQKFDKENQGYTYLLANGIKVYFKPLETLEKRIQIMGLMPNNNFHDFTNSPQELFNVDIFSSTAFYLTMSGHGFKEVANYFRDHEIGLDYSWRDNKNLRLSFPSNKLTEGFEVLYSVFKGVSIDEDAINSFSNTTAYDITSKTTDDRFILGKTFIDTAFPNMSYRLKLKQYKTEYFDIALLNKLLSKNFEDPGAYTFYITGNVSAEELEPIIEKYIGALPTAINKLQKPTYGLGITRKKTSKIEYSRGAKQSLIYYGWVAEPNKTLSTIKEAVIRDIISEALSIKMLEEIREKESGVYSIGNIFLLKGFTSSLGNVLLVIFASQPDRVKELIAKSTVIVNELAQGEFDKNILSQARLGLQTKYKEYEDKLSYTEVMYALEQRGHNPFRGEKIYLETLEHIEYKEVVNYLKVFLEKANYIEVIQNPKKQSN